MLTVTIWPNALCALKPSMTGWVTLVIWSVFESPLSLPPGAGRFGSRTSELVNTIGARRIVKSPRPNVEASRTFGPVVISARPVVGLIWPIDRLRLVTSALGRPAPSPSPDVGSSGPELGASPELAEAARLGNSDHVWPSSVERNTPPSPP